MATPYFQLRLDRVPSTQDVARERIEDLPVLVLATGQSEGRGRSGAGWLTAERALAASLAFRHDEDEARPLSLMAGLAAIDSAPGSTLKWPNDVLRDERKIGGILVERSGGVTVVGFGLNLWWPDPPAGMGAVFSDDPGDEAHAEIGGLWGAAMMELIDSDGWPIDRYRELCETIGEQITWEPDGSGRATDIAEDGALVVQTDSGQELLYSGAVSHVRGGGSSNLR